MKTKRFLILCLFTNLMISSYSQVTSITTIEDGFLIDFNLPIYAIKDTIIYDEYGSNQIYSYIKVEQLGEMIDIGYPNLPQYTIDLHLPFDASLFSVTASNRITETRTLARKVIPAQDNGEEDIQDFFIQEDYYLSNGSLYDFDFQISDTFNIMGANGLSFSIFPFQYNPNANRVEIIKSCKFTLTHNGSSSVQLKSVLVNNSIKDIYLSNIFENYPNLESGSINRGRYLIITAPYYEDALSYFANFKRNIGYEVTVVSTSSTGTTVNDIKAYIQTQYDNSSTRPTFLLLVGDHEDIPASGGSTSGNYEDPLTDLNYARLSGDDYFADVFLGRISVSSIPQLQNIIFKTIYMETNLHNLNRNAILLAGGGVGANQFDKPHRWVMDNVLSKQGFDYDFNFAVDGATRSDGLNALDGDYTLFIYRGHGSKTSLGTPFNLTGSDIDNSTNSVYPFGFGFACNSNNFGHSSACFGERWIRSDHGGISYFGATTPTYRHTNNVIEERVFDKMDDKDQLSPFINLGMKDYYKRFWSWTSGNRRKRHMKSYNLLGDPSIYLYGIGCLDDYIFSNNEIFHAGDRITYHAANSMVVSEANANFIMEDGSEVQLFAGNSITLKPGFFSKLGSEFCAAIAPCNGTSLKSTNIDLNNNEIAAYSEIPESVVSNYSSSNVVTCFPNPAKDNINLYFNINTSELNTISIINITGNTLIQKSISSLSSNEWNNVRVDISELRVGTYFYLINFLNGYEKGKFIKMD